MNSRRRLELFLVLVLLVLSLYLSGCRRLFHSEGVTIEIANSSPQFIRNIEVDFPKGSFGIAALRPGGTRSRWVRITTAGPLKVIFVDDSGEHRSSGPNLNADDSGSIRLEFTGNGKTTFTDLRSHR